MRHNAQRLDPGLCLLQCLGQQVRTADVTVSGGIRTCEPDVVGQGDQLLLRAVVEITLEPPPSGVAGLDQPGTGGAELLELTQGRRSQTLVVEAEPDRWTKLSAVPKGPR